MKATNRNRGQTSPEPPTKIERTAMTTQRPMTAEAVFDGYDFRTNGGPEGTTFYFSGHLTAKEIVEKYRLVYPGPEASRSYTLDTATASRAWHVFTEHEDICYLSRGADEYGPLTPDDYSLCSCEAAHNRECDGRGYEYRHPHPATKSTPGALPVTWVDAA
jgi:hypothetical protein